MALKKKQKGNQLHEKGSNKEGHELTYMVAFKHQKVHDENKCERYELGLQSAHIKKEERYSRICEVFSQEIDLIRGAYM